VAGGASAGVNDELQAMAQRSVKGNGGGRMGAGVTAHSRIASASAARRSMGGGGEGIWGKMNAHVAVAIAGERVGGLGRCGSGPLIKKRFSEF
jgi:hypothetical protein